MPVKSPLRFLLPTKLPAILVASAFLLSPAVGAELLAGTARADITPPIGGSMYGYGARGENVSQGVHDPLYAKALALSDGTTRLAIVTLDLGAFEKQRTARVRERVRAATGVSDVLLVASHSHSAPTYDAAFPDAETPYAHAAEEEIAAAVVRAFAELRPARLAAGRTTVEEGHNRREVRADGTVHMRWANRERLPTAPVDHELIVVAFDTATGEPLATLVNFACHPVVLGPENLLLSADYPGAMTARIEEEIGGQAMFLQGAAGDINPFWDKTAPTEGGFEQMRAMGETLAAAAISVRRSFPAFGAIQTLSVHREEVELSPRWDLDDPAVEAAFRESEFGWIFDIYRARFAAERRAEIATVLFDRTLALGTFPGEFFVEHGLRFKRGSTVPTTVFAGYANGQLGYFPTVRAAAEGGYGGKEATIVEPGAGEHLVTRALVALHRQTGQLRSVPDFGE